MRDASRAMKSIGVMTRWVRPLRGTFSKYAIRPSGSTSIRAERERRAGTITHEPLATLVVAGCDAHRTVDVEPVACRREAALLAVEIRVGVLFGLKRSREASGSEYEARRPV
jgi:hypothetical protein